jgi:uncharacterized C2H2 Zn-finger protein
MACLLSSIWLLYGGLHNALHGALDAVLAVILLVVVSVAVLSYPALPENVTVNPRNVWAPTDLERSLKWTLLSFPIPASQDVLLSRTALNNLAVEPTTSPGYQLLSIRDIPAIREATLPLGILEVGVSQSQDSEALRRMLSPTPTALTQIKCEFLCCDRAFEHKHEYQYGPCKPLRLSLLISNYSRHKKSHIHSKKCPQCEIGFETAKDVNRHINSIHVTTKRFFCTFVKCKYSRSMAGSQGRGFPRKDNWRRHMKKKHSLSEEEAHTLEGDAEMAGI